MPILENEKLLRKLYDHFNAREFDKAADLSTPEVAILNVATGTSYRGRADNIRFMKEWVTAFPDARVELKSVVASEDKVVAEYVGSGTHKGPLASPTGTIPPTGKRINIQFCEFHDLKNGKIANTRMYYDLASMLAQLGLFRGFEQKAGAQAEYHPPT
jgi:steroid delta-isomerase-like uncharacterized protein